MPTNTTDPETTDPASSKEKRNPPGSAQAGGRASARGQSAPRQRFRVVVASDGSPQARVAIQAAIDFPWPANADVLGVVARGGPHPPWSASAAAGVDTVARAIAVEAERSLRRRWSAARVVVDEAAPVEAILRHARGAGAVVVGSRGHSQLERWVLGSVSRGVVRRVRKPVLVVKQRSPAFRHVIVGFDGSNHARRAIDFVASMQVPRGGRVTLLTFVDTVTPPAIALLPTSVRRLVAKEAKAFSQKLVKDARGKLERAARPLGAAGWRVRLDVRAGVASRDLVTAPSALGADLLVIGAQGAGGWTRLLLGSVAEAVLDRAPVSTLLVR